MKKYKVIAFDYDLTIADTSGIIAERINYTLKKFGYNELPFMTIAPYIGNLGSIILRELSGEKDPEKLEEMFKFYRGEVRQILPDNSGFFEGVTEGVKKLTEAGYRLGVVSLKPHKQITDPMRRYNIRQYFDIVIGSDDVPYFKPDPTGIFKTLEFFGVEKSEYLYVGDSLTDQQTAENAGVDFGAMLKGFTTKEQFEVKGADYYFENFNMLCKELIK